MALQVLLSIQNISKAFPGVQALSDVSFDVLAGEVHALVGENGAGKSTLMKILTGVYRPDSGRILWDGQPLSLHNPADAQRKGISIIFQEFNLLPDLTVAENVLLNHEPRTRFGTIDWRAMNLRTRELLALLETDIDPERLVGSLNVAQQQIVEIVKALAFEARLVIMDEPTAALNTTEVDHLFSVIERLKAHGTAVIFISHRLDEILHISQRVTVMKDGCVVATEPTAGQTKENIVSQMVGRDLSDIFPPRCIRHSDQPLLEVRGLSTRESLSDVSFTLYPGEIVGFAGLEGQGQREVARALFGIEPISHGTILINGAPVRLKNPRSAIEAGVAFISDDRKEEGLALRLAVRDNVALPNLDRFSRMGAVQPQRELSAVSQIVELMRVRTPSLEQEVRFLSGGNQQKTVLAKWLIGDPRILIFVEPTRGIDIGAKFEIYQLMHELVQKGTGILMVSSELLELIGMSSRILVMHKGTIRADLPAESASEETVMRVATGVDAGNNHVQLN